MNHVHDQESDDKSLNKNMQSDTSGNHESTEHDVSRRAGRNSEYMQHQEFKHIYAQVNAHISKLQNKPSQRIHNGCRAWGCELGTPVGAATRGHHPNWANSGLSWEDAAGKVSKRHLPSTPSESIIILSSRL